MADRDGRAQLVRFYHFPLVERPQIIISKLSASDCSGRIHARCAGYQGRKVAVVPDHPILGGKETNEQMADIPALALHEQASCKA